MQRPVLNRRPLPGAERLLKSATGSRSDHTRHAHADQMVNHHGGWVDDDCMSTPGHLLLWPPPVARTQFDSSISQPAGANSALLTAQSTDRPEFRSMEFEAKPSSPRRSNDDVHMSGLRVIICRTFVMKI